MAAQGLAKLRAQIDKTYGQRLLRRETLVRPQAIPTGSLTLDHALGVGGWALKRSHELVGPEGQGKTTLAILGMVNALEMFPDRGVAFIDMEQAFDPDWARKLGLDVDDEEHVFIIQPDDSEDVSDLLNLTLQDGFISMAVLDSVGAMESKVAFAKKAEDYTVGRNANIISRMVKQTASTLRMTNSTWLAINQYRAEIGSVKGPALKSAGPLVLKYSTTTKVSLRRTGEPAIKIKVTDSVTDAKHDEMIDISRQIRAKVERNKLAPQGRSADFWLTNVETPAFKIGIDQADEAVALGLATGAIERVNSSVYKLPDGTKINGRGNVKAAVLERPAVLEQIRQHVLDSVADTILPEHEVALDGEVPEGVDPKTREIL